MSYSGIDVSEFQGSIDWNQVKAAGNVFAIIRQADDEHDDPYFLTNVDQALAVGLHVGCYYLTRSQTEDGSRQDARDLVEALAGRAVDMPLYLDLEASEVAGCADVIARAWYEECQAMGYKAGIYCSLSWYQSYMDSGYWSDKPVWIARYDADDAGTDDAGIWQFSETGSLQGIDGNVDLDVAYVAEWESGGAPEPAKQAEPAKPAKPVANQEPLAPGMDKDCVNVFYQAHVQNIGWQPACFDGAIAGTTGKSLRMEAIAVMTRIPGISVLTSAHIENIGWQEWRDGAKASGTTGGELRMEAVRIKLEGLSAADYDVVYQGHVQGIGWLGLERNGGIAGSTGCSLRLEALRVWIVKSGEQPTDLEKSGYPAAINCPTLSLQSHVQDIGWGAIKTGGSKDVVTTGTTGMSKRLECLRIVPNLAGHAISGIAHVQDLGWCKDQPGDAGIGTTGKSRRLEAIKLGLSGSLSGLFDLYYRVHVQNVGWMGWAKNSDPAGTTGYSFRIEAVQAVILPKGDPAPGSMDGAFKEKPAKAPVVDGNLREKIVAIALDQEGYTEDDDWTKYGQWYEDTFNAPGFARGEWCAMLVSWCARQANVPEDVLKSFAYVPYMVGWFRQQGRLHPADGSYDPKPGDVIFFRWDCAVTDECDHVGLVVRFDGTTVDTIEGNTGSGTPICKKGSYNFTWDCIIWYGEPSY